MPERIDVTGHAVVLQGRILPETHRMPAAFEPPLLKEPQDVVVVEGDRYVVLRPLRRYVA